MKDTLGNCVAQMICPEMWRQIYCEAAFLPDFRRERETV